MNSRLAAYKKAVSILSASDNTRAELIGKLTKRGFSPEEAECAADAAEAEGFLREIPHAERLVQTMYERGCGPRLILAKLRAKSFSDAAMKAAMKYMKTLDFTACAKALYVREKASGKPREKILASLSRKGFDIKQ